MGIWHGGEREDNLNESNLEGGKMKKVQAMGTSLRLARWMWWGHKKAG